LIKIIGNRNCIKRKFLYPFISKIFLIFVLLVFFCSLNQSCKKSRRWSKEWEEAFESFQPTDKILDTIGVKPNMVIGEVGAGNGRVAVKAAAIVGENGRVYANDIDDKAIRFMKNRCRNENINNMVVVKGKVTDPCLPKGELDLVYIINSYEHFAAPVELLKNISPALKSGGTLAIIATDPNKLKANTWHSTPKETILRHAEIAGYRLVRIETFLQNDNIYIFQVKKEI